MSNAVKSTEELNQMKEENRMVSFRSHPNVCLLCVVEARIYLTLRNFHNGGNFNSPLAHGGDGSSARTS